MIPLFSWGSEKKYAYELFVKAKYEFIKKNCYLNIFQEELPNLLFKEINISEEKYLKKIEHISSCLKFYEKNTLPIFDSILNDYSNTKFSSKLRNSNLYLSSDLIKTILPFLENAKFEYDNKYLFNELDIENFELKDLPEYIEMLKSEPLTNTEINNFVKQLNSCLTILPNIEYPKIKIKVKIEVGRNRVIKKYEFEEKIKNIINKDRKILAMVTLIQQAISNPKCEVLDLPPDKFIFWRDVEYTFDFEDI